MSVTAIPVIFLITLVVLTQSGKDVSSYSNVATDKKTYLAPLNYNYSTVSKQEEDRMTIYSYIRQTFKKIKEEDAKKIADGLVAYGKKFDLDPKFAAAVIARESGFKKDAVSHTGAKGLGQIKDFNFKALNINNPFKIEENVSGTVEYLKKMIGKWKDQPGLPTKAGKNSPALTKKEKEQQRIKLALASYYKGYTGVKKTGVDEKTEKYVDDIIAYYKDILTHKK